MFSITPDAKHPVQNCDNMLLPIQMQLSEQ